jgi:hypothetical protein
MSIYSSCPKILPKSGEDIGFMDCHYRVPGNPVKTGTGKTGFRRFPLLQLNYGELS